VSSTTGLARQVLAVCPTILDQQAYPLRSTRPGAIVGQNSNRVMIRVFPIPRGGWPGCSLASFTNVDYRRSLQSLIECRNRASVRSFRGCDGVGLVMPYRWMSTGVPPLW
jgi:hypothetical protein